LREKQSSILSFAKIYVTIDLHSYRKASTGSNLAALFGKQHPAYSHETQDPHRPQMCVLTKCGRTNSGKLVCMFRRSILGTCLLIIAVGLANRASAQHSRPSDGYQIVHAYPHDPDAFTQGLVYVDGHLYESTGQNGKSSIRMVDLSTGRVLQRYDLAAKYFGEGLTSWGSDLVQLTWKSGLAFVYDRFTFAAKRTLHYEGEGWGLTHDDKRLILSDGTSALRFLDPQSFSETKRILVTDEEGHPLANINELEYIRGEIYANIWHTDQIVRISPHTGKILGRIDLSGIMNKGQLSDPEAVLNGIAYDGKGDRLFVTGKLWPQLFEIKVVHQVTGLQARRQNPNTHPPH
jgi:glutamine cyclotransferase